MEKSTRELEWFDLEIRTRELIHQQLEPVLIKAREDREAVLNLKNYSVKLEKRVHDLEVAVLGDKPQETVISNLYERCAEIEGQRKKDVINLEQTTERINEKIKGLFFSIEKITEDLNLIHGNEKTTEIELEKITKIFDDNKLIITEEIAKLDDRFKEMNNIYQDVSVKAEERSVLAMNKAQTNNLEMGNYKREVENIRKQILEALTLVREVKSNKLEETDFNAVNTQNDARFLRLSEELGKVRDEIFYRDRFTDKFLPLQIATMISDHMHYTLDLPQKKRLAEYESMNLQILNSQAISSDPIDSRTIKAEKILNGMKHLEERKVKLLTDSKEKEPEIKQVKLKKIVKEEAKNPSFQQSITEVPDLKEVENLISAKLGGFESSILSKIQAEITARHESNRNYLKVIIDENNALLHQVIQEVDENTKTVKKDLSVLFKELNSLKAVSDELKNFQKNSEIAQVYLTKMLVCLVENAQIEQALQAQDEEDRQTMVNSYEKEYANDLALSKPTPEPYQTSLPSALAVQKKCLGCGGNSTLLSGLKTTVMYKPTPLVYRNKKFERNILINFRGKMVKDCWETVNRFIPWKQEDMENLVSNTYKVIKTDDENNSLPVLTSATRTRSYHHRKINSFRGYN